MNVHRILLFALLYMAACALFAQNSIKGTVADETETPLQGAVITVSADDGTVVSKAATDGKGGFQIDVARGKYLLKATFVGFHPFEAEVDARKDVTLNIAMQPDTKELGQVVVKGRMITYDTKGYRANIQTDPVFRSMKLSEVLPFLPGIMVTGSGLRAYHEAVIAVYINGKRMHLGNRELLQYLGSFDAQNIKSIDIQNSSAEPGTMGSGYVMRINTLRVSDGGFLTPSLPVSYSTLSHFSSSPSLSFMEQWGKWSVVASANASSYSKRKQEREGHAEYFDADVRRDETELHYSRYRPKLDGNVAVSYDFTPKSSITMSAKTTSNNALLTSQTHNKLYENGSLRGETSGMAARENKRHQHDFVADYRLNLKKVALTAVASYSKNKDDMNNERQQLNQNTGEASHEHIRRSSDDQYYQLTTTGKWTLNPHHILSLALTYNGWDSDAADRNTSPAQAFAALKSGNEAETSTDYSYREDSYVANAAYNYIAGKFDIQVGTALRHTKSTAKLLGSEGTTIGHDDNDMLPYVVVAYLINRKKGQRIQASYHTSLQYPNFREMMPAVQWNSEYATRIGNTDLPPIKKKEASMTLTLFGVSWTTSYAHSTTNMWVPTLDGSTLVTNMVKENGCKEDELISSMMYTTLFKKWRIGLQGGGRYYHGRNNTDSGHNLTWFCTASAARRLPWNLTFNGSLARNISVNGLYTKNNPIIMGNASLSKSLLKNALTVSLRYNATSKFKLTTTARDHQTETGNVNLNHRITLSLRYNLRWGHNKRVYDRHRVGYNMELNRLGGNE